MVVADSLFLPTIDPQGPVTEDELFTSSRKA